MKRDTCVAYVEYVVKLAGCVPEIEAFRRELDAWLTARLQPDYSMDILVEIECSTPPVQPGTSQE